MPLYIPEWRGKPYRLSDPKERKRLDEDKAKQDEALNLEIVAFVFGLVVFGLICLVCL